MPETTDVYRRAFLVKDWLNPELGNIGPLDFVQRVLSNISYYAFIIPERVLFFRYDKFLGSWSLQQLVNPWLWRGLILAGVLGGLIICLRQRRSAIEYTTGAYLAMLAIWHVADPRYLVPIIPFLLYY